MRDRARSYEELLSELEQTQAALSELKAVTFYRSSDPKAQPSCRDDVDYQAVFRASSGILLLLTPDLRMVDASDSRVEATMVRREDFVGRYLFDVFPDNPDNAGAAGKTNLQASLMRVLQTRRPDNMDLQRYDLRCPDGTFEERYWRPLNEPVLGPEGDVRYILHHVEDATEDVLALARRTRELEVQRDLTRRIVDNAPIGIALYDQDLVIRYFNQTLASLLNVRVDDVLDRTVEEAFPKLDAAAVDRQFRQVLRTGVAFEEKGLALTHIDKDGVERTTYWDLMNLPMHGPDGRTVEVFSIATEVSDRIQNERLQRERIEMLEQVDRYKDQLLGIVSHELRTPINGIMGFASILMDGLVGKLNSDQQRSVGKILDGSDTLLALVNDLLDMSRVQAGKFALDLQTVEVASIIRGALAALFPEAIQKGHSLLNQVPSMLPSLRADPARVSQIVSNLVTNAIKYTPDGGTITVRACADGESLRVEVTDTGIGIAPEQQSNIFQPFTQVDMSNTRERGGVGLGLSIVKGLVEAHGGQVGVESEPGRGSTFWFTVPLTQG